MLPIARGSMYAGRILSFFLFRRSSPIPNTCVFISNPSWIGMVFPYLMLPRGFFKVVLCSSSRLNPVELSIISSLWGSTLITVHFPELYVILQATVSRLSSNAMSNVPKYNCCITRCLISRTGLLFVHLARITWINKVTVVLVSHVL